MIMEFEKILKELELKQDEIYSRTAEQNITNVAFCEGFIQGQTSGLQELRKIFDKY